MKDFLLIFVKHKTELISLHFTSDEEEEEEFTVVKYFPTDRMFAEHDVEFSLRRKLKLLVFLDVNLTTNQQCIRTSLSY